MDKSKNLYGHLFALTANVMWGLMSPIGKSALQEFSPISVTTFRMVGAAAAFWILSIFCKQEHVNHQDMLKIFFASLFALVFNQGVFIFGLSMTSPIDASIVTTTLPIVTMVVAAIYLKEPITNKKVMGFYRCYGSAHSHCEQPGRKQRKWKPDWRPALSRCANQFLHIPDCIQGIVSTIFGSND